MDTKNNVQTKPPALFTGVRNVLAACGVLACVATVSAQKQALPAPAWPAEDFVETIAINASPFDTYVTEGRWKGAGTKYPLEMLSDLGVRYYRMCMKHALTPEDTPEKVRALWEAKGMRALLLVDPGKSGTIENLVEIVKTFDPKSVAGFEGPNEANNKFYPQDLNLKYKDATDEAAAAKYMDDVYAALKADTATKDIPVVAFTAIFTDYSLARPHLGFDFANMHSYQGYNVPSSSLMMNVTRFNNVLPEGAVIRPFMPTECGYNVEADVNNATLLTGNRWAQARNIPMLLAEYFRHGIARTYLFAIHNADGYGLLEDDQETKRPAYFALKNFIALLSDAQWDPAVRAWRREKMRPRPLFFSLGNAPDTVHTLALRKANGDYYLLIWNEVKNFDHDSKRILDPPDVPVTLSFQTRLKPGAKIFRQNDGGGYDATDATVAGDALALGVSAAVTIVRLSPVDTSPAPVLAPVDAAGIKERVTENEIEFSWAPVPGANGYFIYRNGMHVATTREPRHADHSEWIRPGLGYTFGIQPYNVDGAYAETTGKVFTTPNKRPDLVVEKIGADKPFDKIKEGDKVKFNGAIRNAGDGATPHNVSVALTFSVDGKVVGWGGDGPGKNLKAGEVLDITASGGPDGWLATPGVHILSAFADDINRVSGERDENNNHMDMSFFVGNATPGMLQASSRSSSWRVNLSEEGVLDWIAWGQGGTEGVVRKKDGGNLISAVRKKGQNHMGATGGCPVRLVWDDGDTVAAQPGANTGLWTNGKGNGMEFDVDAGTHPRTLKVYVAGNSGAAGTFRASLSDGSAPEVTSETWRGNRARGNSPVPGNFAAVYTVRFKAASDGQKLTVSWTMRDEPNQWKGQMRMQAATLSE